MSDLRPTGTAITIGGVERHFLFTLAVIDEIQSTYDQPVSEVINRLANEKDVYQTVAYLALVLINDEIERNNYFKGSSDPLMTEKELKWLITMETTKDVGIAIMKAYGLSLPEDDEDEDDDDPNVKRSRNN